MNLEVYRMMTPQGALPPLAIRRRQIGGIYEGKCKIGHYSSLQDRGKGVIRTTSLFLEGDSRFTFCYYKGIHEYR